MGPSYEELLETTERLELRVLDLEHREHELFLRWHRERKSHENARRELDYLKERLTPLEDAGDLSGKTLVNVKAGEEWISLEFEDGMFLWDTTLEGKGGFGFWMDKPVTRNTTGTPEKPEEIPEEPEETVTPWLTKFNKNGHFQFSPDFKTIQYEGVSVCTRSQQCFVTRFLRELFLRLDKSGTDRYLSIPQKGGRKARTIQRILKDIKNSQHKEVLELLIQPVDVDHPEPRYQLNPTFQYSVMDSEEPQEEPDWSKAPSWANWWAVDYDGEACWFDERPTLDKDGIWLWVPHGKFESIGDLPEPKDPKSTLRKRPEPREFTPNWENAARRYAWCAVDPEGSVWWFRLKPNWNPEIQEWRCSIGNDVDRACPIVYPGGPVTPEVAKTLLFKRPRKTK